MQNIKKYFMTLALLIAAVGGAWADGIVCTASDLGKVLCTDGSIYENVSAATTAGKTAVAMIAYVDETNKNGLAIALADESGKMNWSTAKSTCEGKTAIAGVKWCLPSQDQWKQMFKANGGNDARYTGLNATITTAGGYALKEEGASYWSSSEAAPGAVAYRVNLDDSDADWYTGSEGSNYQVRACLAFDITEPAPEVIELKPDETGKKWILADMPASNIELQVEYYTESNLFLSKDALKDKASIAVTAGELGVQFGEDGKSANPVTEGTAMTVKYNGAKKILGMKVAKYNDALSTALTIEAITAGTIVVNNPKDGMKYKLNGVDKGAVTSTAINVSKDDKVQFYGTATSYNGTQFAGTAEVKVYGNIMSLVSADFADNKVLTADNAFASLFKNYTTLKDASALLLPATTLTTYCYGSMFMGCSNLTAAPKLPATTLATDCYWRLFKDCTSLKEVYVKAAYDSGPCTSMFHNCSAADATLHTTSDNKASWTGKVPENWTIDEGWTD